MSGMTEMTLSLHSFMLCIITTFICRCQGLQFSIDRTSDGTYCGTLHCLADKKVTPNISSVHELTIFNITERDTETRIASISLFHTEPEVEENAANLVKATGSASVSHAELTLAFLNEDDCEQGSFVCELDFVNTDDQQETVREFVISQTREEETSILNVLSVLAQQLHTLTSSTATQLENLNKTVEAQLAEAAVKISTIETKLETVFLQLKWFQEFINSTRGAALALDECYRNMAHSSPRERLVLWGQIQTLCDTETDGGGWVVIQRRFNGDVNFNRNWQDYKTGFGTPGSDFWIGNDAIHNLTSRGYNQLRIDLTYDGKQNHSQYSRFQVGDENSKYQLTVGGYTGTDVDNLAYNNGSSFSTPERDNDLSSGNCASDYHSGWWFNDCGFSDLNGGWGNEIFWSTGAGNAHPTFTEIKVRQTA